MLMYMYAKARTEMVAVVRCECARLTIIMSSQNAVQLKMHGSLYLYDSRPTHQKDVFE